MAQLVARRSHNPEVVSSILTGSSIAFYHFELVTCVTGMENLGSMPEAGEANGRDLASLRSSRMHIGKSRMGIWE